MIFLLITLISLPNYQLEILDRQFATCRSSFNRNIVGSGPCIVHFIDRNTQKMHIRLIFPESKAYISAELTVAFFPSKGE